MNIPTCKSILDSAFFPFLTCPFSISLSPLPPCPILPLLPSFSRYVSDSTGNLRFQEGVLVQAVREGWWIVLDELNLAPSDVLEALNRLLDDNRELFGTYSSLTFFVPHHCFPLLLLPDDV